LPAESVPARGPARREAAGGRGAHRHPTVRPGRGKVRRPPRAAGHRRGRDARGVDGVHPGQPLPGRRAGARRRRGPRRGRGEAGGHGALGDTGTRTRLRHTRPATHEVTQVAISPDGTLVAVAPGHDYARSGRGARVISENRDGLLLDAATGAVKFRLPAGGDPLSTRTTGVAFRPDGRRVLTAF